MMTYWSFGFGCFIYLSVVMSLRLVFSVLTLPNPTPRLAFERGGADVKGIIVCLGVWVLSCTINCSIGSVQYS